MGTWKIEDVARNGIPEESLFDKLTPRFGEEVQDSPWVWAGKTSKKRDTTSRRFLFEIKKGDWAVSPSGGNLCFGRIKEGPFSEATTLSTRTVASKLQQNLRRWKDETAEPFKFYHIEQTYKIPLSKLPPAIRLLSAAGRSTLCKPDRLKRLLEKIISSLDSAGLETMEDLFKNVKTAELLEMLGPYQFEAICWEYLRDKIKNLYLLAGVGRTLKDVDLVGSSERQIVIAQCKYKDTKDKDVTDWADNNEIKEGGDLEAFWFCRNFAGKEKDHVKVVQEKDIEAWLEKKETEPYLRALSQSWLNR